MEFFQNLWAAALADPGKYGATLAIGVLFGAVLF